MRLKVGFIQYANVYPIFYVLEREGLLTEDIHLVRGVPSQLNWALRNDLIDLSPSSSVEYLLNRELYEFIDGISISSQESVGSVLLFSDCELERIDGKKILLTDQSATSHLLLRTILEEFMGLKPHYELSSIPQSGEIFLLIGDEALKYRKLDDKKKVYDLANLWYRHTGLPFVFALWIVRREVLSSLSPLYEKYVSFKEKLLYARDRCCYYFEEMAKNSYLKGFMNEDEIISYWSHNMDYRLEESHKKSLTLFEGYVKKLINSSG